MFTFRVIRCGLWLAALWLSIFAFAQAPDGSGVATVPVISGGVAFVPFVQAGRTTLVSIFSPVLLVPLAARGKSGSFTPSRADKNLRW
jgi:hypothetical protein